MPFTSVLKAAMTLCEPGVSRPVIFGLTSVRRAAGAVAAGVWTSVLVVWRAGVRVGTGVLVVRGRTVGEEFEFWANAQVAKAKTKRITSIELPFIIAPVMTIWFSPGIKVRELCKLHIAECIHSVKPWY